LILDHIDHLEFNSKDADYLFDAQMTLGRLSQGLFWLYDSVAKIDRGVHIKALKENVKICISNGVLQDIPSWLPCAFQWYAVSAYNYARLVGWLATRDKKYIKDYVKRVMPRIAEYRHKIAAHFAITQPRGDSDADQIASIMTNIVYANQHLLAGALSEILTDEKGNEDIAKNKTSWSLTKSHLELIPRYWPDGPLDAHQSIQISPGATRKIRVDYGD
jgi:hypothetical protein